MILLIVGLRAMRRLSERERIVRRMQEVSRDIAMVDKLLTIEVKGSDYGHLIKRRKILYEMYLSLNRQLVSLDGVDQPSLFDEYDQGDVK
jgi:hypothetical protein